MLRFFCVFFYQGMLFIIYFLKFPALVKGRFWKNDDFFKVKLPDIIVVFIYMGRCNSNLRVFVEFVFYFLSYHELFSKNTGVLSQGWELICLTLPLVSWKLKTLGYAFEEVISDISDSFRLKDIYFGWGRMTVPSVFCS